MAEFKSSKLIVRLENECELSNEAWAFIDACTDDWCVDEDNPFIGSDSHYEIRFMCYGTFNGKECGVTQIYYGDLEAIAMTIEHLAYLQTLEMKDRGFGVDEEA